MRTLVIESATEACSVALFEGDRLVAGEHRIIGRGHAEQLVPMIAALPGRGEAARIVVSLGPGSFTGTRIGLAAARALALAWGAECLGYPTLALVAAIAREQGSGPVTVCMTGGHGEWFVQDFGSDGLPESALASLSPEAAGHRANHDRIAGTQAEALIVRQGSGTATALWPDASFFPLLPSALFTADLAPIYGRAPDARLPGAAA
jgi:tRNA threonylcarbamoyladenosine biosynthesis protein TsaB